MRTAVIFAREAAWAARRLARAPAFTAVAVLTVAVAVAPSLIFRLVDRAVLPPLPFDRSDELIDIRQAPEVGGGRRPVSYPWLSHLRAHSRVVDVAGETYVTLSLRTDAENVQVQTGAVTPNFFDVLRARPLIGRVFREDENQHPFGHPVIVLSERLWRRHCGARPTILDEKLILNGVAFSVVGVMPEEFHESWFDWTGISRTGAWIPAMMAPVGMRTAEWRTAKPIEYPYATIWVGLGRLRPGYGLREARAEMAVLGQQVKSLWPGMNAYISAPFDPILLKEVAVDPKIGKAVLMLRVAGLLVLVLGALNLGNMFLARGADRARTIGLHVVLGAPRFGLACGALAEALFVGAGGAAVGVMLTLGALLGLGLAEPTILTAPFGVTFNPAAFQIDRGLVGAALVLCATAAVFFGIVPAWKTTRVDASTFLRGGAGVTGGGLERLRITRPGGLLVVAEVTFALALTLPALLLVRSVGTLVQADLGFKARGVTTAEIRLPSAEYSPEAAATFVEQALDRLRVAPGVEGAGFVNGVPLSDSFFTSLVRPTSATTGGFVATVHVVSPGAFRTLGIRLEGGRDFGPEDRGQGPPVAVLSEAGARLVGGHPVGARVDVMTLGGRTVEVVGVAGNLPYRDLALQQLPAIYLPLAQMPLTEGALVLQTAGTTSEAATLLRNTVTSLNPRLRTTAVEALADRIDRALARFRGATWLLGVAACLALFLSGIGVYGLLSSLVARSVPEIGVRIALGAAPAAIGRHLAQSSLLLATVGLCIGVGLGSWGATYLEGYLYGVRRYDAAALLMTLAAAAALALLAALQPARRAGRVDPMVALRCE